MTNIWNSDFNVGDKVLYLGSETIPYDKDGNVCQLIVELIDIDKIEINNIHTDVSFVNASDELDIEKFKAWREDYKDAEFILEDGKYIVGREVEKMSKSKYNVVSPDDICEEY